MLVDMLYLTGMFILIHYLNLIVYFTSLDLLKQYGYMLKYVDLQGVSCTVCYILSEVCEEHQQSSDHRHKIQNEI